MKSRWVLALMLMAATARAEVTDATVDGVRVLIDRVPGAELVVIDLDLRGGARRWSGADAGIEELALAVARDGTTTLGTDSLMARLAALRGRLSSTSSLDFGRLRARGLVGNFAPLFDLVADTYLFPSLSPRVVAEARARQLRELDLHTSAPDHAAWELIRAALFAGQPYAHGPTGTVASVSALTGDAIAAHLQRLRTKSALLVVVVGDVDPQAVIAKVHARFASLPPGTPLAPLPPSPPVAGLQVEARALPTNFVLAGAPGPRWGDVDFAPALVAMRVLDRRFFDEVRSQRGLSYAAHALFRDRAEQPACELSVSAVDPAEAFGVMLRQVDRLAHVPVSDDELAEAVAALRTQFWRGQEGTDERADAVASGQLFGNDWRLARDLPAAAARVTAADVQRFARRYLHDWQIAFLGNARLADHAVFKPAKR